MWYALHMHRTSSPYQYFPKLKYFLILCFLVQISQHSTKSLAHTKKEAIPERNGKKPSSNKGIVQPNIESSLVSIQDAIKMKDSDSSIVKRTISHLEISFQRQFLHVSSQKLPFRAMYRINFRNISNEHSIYVTSTSGQVFFPADKWFSIKTSKAALILAPHAATFVYVELLELPHKDAVNYVNADFKIVWQESQIQAVPLVASAFLEWQVRPRDAKINCDSDNLKIDLPGHVLEEGAVITKTILCHYPTRLRQEPSPLSTPTPAPALFITSKRTISWDEEMAPPEPFVLATPSKADLVQEKTIYPVTIKFTLPRCTPSSCKNSWEASIWDQDDIKVMDVEVNLF